MFNNIEAMERIRQNLYNISANLHAEAYTKDIRRTKRIKNDTISKNGYVPSNEATEALEFYKLSLKSDEWSRETEEEIKGYIMKTRILNENLLLDNKDYWKTVLNKKAI